MFNLSADRVIHSFNANMENEEGCFDGAFWGEVADARVVHHWDGSLDGAFGEVMVAVVVHHWDGSL